VSAVLDRSAPGVRVSIVPDEHAVAGERLDLAGRILGFTFEDAERRADKATLTLDNHDLSLFDRDELVGGQLLEVSWGYPGHMSRPRRVAVRKLKGFSTLTIEGRALSTLMDREAHTRTWIGVTRSAVARAVAEEHGYEGAFVDVDDTEEVFDTIAQTAETDARFLRRLAAREEFEFYVDDGGLHFHERRQSAAPTHVFTWYADQGRGDLLDVSVESDLTRRVARVTVRGRDPIERSTIEESANNESTDRDTLGEVPLVIDRIDGETGATRTETTPVLERNATETVRPTSAATAAQARREARARFRRAERASVRLSLKVVGDPTLNAKSIVEVRGISAALSGLYYVTSVKHSIASSGYTCELKATRDGTGRRARALVAERRGAPAAASDAEPELGGDRNRSEATDPHGELEPIELLDGETGATVLEYRRGGQPLGGADPEARS